MKIRRFLLSSVLLFLLLSACKSDDDVIDLPEDIEGNWSLLKKTGGFAGVDCTYPVDQIAFSFTEEEVAVVNNFTDTTSVCQFYLDSDTYSFDIIEQSENHYLVVDGEEWGLMQVMDGMISVNGNQRSTGSGADFFSYIFERK